jgi:hypothetical protein
MDDSSEHFMEDSLPTPEILLHITIHVISCINAAEETRSLLIEEVSLCEFLLDQILLLKESMEPSLVPHVIEELLGTELVIAPPSAEGPPPPVALTPSVVDTCP